MREVAAELKALRLYGMAGAWGDLLSQGGSASLESSRWLIEHLLQAESVERNVRSISYQMKAARFPIHRDLSGFRFESSVVDKRLIQELATFSFTTAAHNAVFIGGPGTGKTHLATAIGTCGITEHGRRVRFYSTVDLVNTLELEKNAGKTGRLAQSLLNVDLVILDELGYLPFSQVGGALLFHLLSSRRNNGRLSSLVKIQPPRPPKSAQFSTGADISKRLGEGKHSLFRTKEASGILRGKWKPKPGNF
ncbi:MAG: ATP-binding protein [Rhodoferax sp.]|nr:ATP-binding protein [Rhodoferax sp.]